MPLSFLFFFFTCFFRVQERFSKLLSFFEATAFFQRGVFFLDRKVNHPRTRCVIRRATTARYSEQENASIINALWLAHTLSSFIFLAVKTREERREKKKKERHQEDASRSAQCHEQITKSQSNRMRERRKE